MHRSRESRPVPAITGQAGEWWRDAVFYQIYIRSFHDSNGDGVGDLDGIRERLDYLCLLGVDALWITPFYPSPMADHGYDVADPRGVDPLFGDLEAFDALVSAAHERGLKVTIDLVPNHVSDHHPWFQKALAAGRDSSERDRFLFRDGRGEGGAEPPNNWQSIFGGPAWTRVDDGEWYLHLFAPEQPDLNWDHPDVLLDFERTMRFWLDRGVDGFRLDVAHGLAKPRGLPDVDDSQGTLLAGDGPPRFDNDGVHDIHRMVRRVLDSYPNRVAVGEVWVMDTERLSRYVRPDELHLAFNFRLVESPWDAEEFTDSIVHSLNTVRGVGAPPTWVLSNHDVVRHVTRFGGGEIGRRRGRAAVLLQLALPGAAFVYNGDELGLPNVDLPDDTLQDPIWERSGRTVRGRDGERIPIPWGGAKPPYDFSTATSTWLPSPENWEEFTVEAQLEDPDSMLSLYRAALEIRHRHAASGNEVEWFGAPHDCLAFRRRDGLVCALNASNRGVPLPPGEVLLSSGPLEPGVLPPDTSVWLLQTTAPPATPTPPTATTGSAVAPNGTTGGMTAEPAPVPPTTAPQPDATARDARAQDTQARELRGQETRPQEMPPGTPASAPAARGTAATGTPPGRVSTAAASRTAPPAESAKSVESVDAPVPPVDSAQPPPENTPPENTPQKDTPPTQPPKQPPMSQIEAMLAGPDSR